MLLDIRIVVTTTAEGEVLTLSRHKGGIWDAGNDKIAGIWGLV